MLKKICVRLFILSLLILACYGVGRLYFHLTAGFTIANITSDFSYNPEWAVRDLSSVENVELEQAMNQSYTYLGKGCQSYVFLSQDGQYVIKFFKYQRFRLLPWLAYSPSLPAVVQYRQEKLEKKWEKLDGFIKSWKMAFENLKDETALIYVHLNKTKHLNTQLVIFDKIGSSHSLNLDQMEFCIQRKADMLCDVLMHFKEQNNIDGAKLLVTNLLNLVISEYHRGFADNDHALMQNTGVAQGIPIHIDIGQFVENEKVRDSSVYHQELFTKTYKFKFWLGENYPELAIFLENQLEEIMGPSYSTMKPKFRIK